MNQGCVYVITTADYEKTSIFKIGCTSNIRNRLKTLNATRIEADKFKIKTTIFTNKYFELEQGLHKLLCKYRLNNEFFKCPYRKIISSIQKFADNQSCSFIFLDVIADFSNKNNLIYDGQMWTIEQDNITHYLTDDHMISQLKRWITDYDKHKLFINYAHRSYWEDILQTLRDNYTKSTPMDIVELDLSDDDIQYLCNRFYCSIVL
jgi:hypothetical protein